MKRHAPLPLESRYCDERGRPLEAVPPEFSLVDAVLCGFHWCQTCRRVTEKVGPDGKRSEAQGVYDHCQYCHSTAVTFHPPTMSGNLHSNMAEWPEDLRVREFPKERTA